MATISGKEAPNPIVSTLVKVRHNPYDQTYSRSRCRSHLLVEVGPNLS